MSNRSDLRMYVEHLFEGRTLDAETIELKEEIYGNLVARFDDYVAQGMNEQEAYDRTCEAVTSVDDVLETDGEKVGRDETAAADEPTVVATPVMGATTAPEAPTAPTTAGRKRLGRGGIAAIVAVALVVIVGGYVVANGLINDRYDQPVTQASTQDETTTTPQDQGGAEGQTSTTTDGGPAAQGQGTQGGNGNGNGNGTQNATGLDAEVYAHDVSTLSELAGMAVSDDRFLQMMSGLPLGPYAQTSQVDPNTGTIELTYAYEDRDTLTYDDDCVDRALVYDVAVAMAAVPDLTTLRIVEEETNPYDPDRDVRVFDRATVERLLGLSLRPDLLTADQWSGVRDQIMGTRVWDTIWESSEIDD